MGLRHQRAVSLTADERIGDYVRELFATEDDALMEIRARHIREGLPEIFISPEEAKIIVVLLRAVGARRVLEVGTLGGYSGVWIARALPPDGELVTVEHDPHHARFAQTSFEAAGVDDRVQLIEGAALDVLTGLEPGFDAVFLDADKAPLGDYCREALRLLRVGGLFLCDNALINGRVVDPDDTEPDVQGVRACNQLAASDERLVSTIIPVRDGLTVGVKVKD